MYKYTSNGILKKDNIVEQFENNKKTKICFNNEFNESESLCIGFNDLLELKRTLKKDNNYSIDYNKYISNNTTLRLNDTNIAKCKKTCNSNNWCESFSYNNITKSCSLSNTNKAKNKGKDIVANLNIDYYEKLY